MKLTENIMPISNISSKKDDIENELNDVYASLFNSLGVEPGLLSKTSIGRNLNKQYHDDSIDAKTYAIEHIQKHNYCGDKTAVTIDKYNPIDNEAIPSDTIVGVVPVEIDHLWQIIRKVQLRDKLSLTMILSEIYTYLTKYYADDHTVKDIIFEIERNLNDK